LIFGRFIASRELFAEVLPLILVQGNKHGG
jgi:hypothetical protein